ncbi:MFS transporter, partial [Streptomyces sp. NPDC007070]|uniref:MFS transporter n=1 Tax=Streptomyces sp. NPDC007070 TaxID=3154312 RepID=UPI0033E77329
ATACLAGGTTALRALAAVTGLAYLAAAALARSVRLRADPAAAPAEDRTDASAPRMRALLAANVVYVFCLNVPEVALPLILVTHLHASAMWSATVFVANTVLVVALQVPVTVLLSRLSRRTVLALAGVVLAASYLGFLAATALGPGWSAPAVAAVSVVCTLGEIVYAGSATALVTALAPSRALGRALTRFQLSTGLGLAVSPAAITTLAAHGEAALWGTLAATTLLAAGAVAMERHAHPTGRSKERAADAGRRERGVGVRCGPPRTAVPPPFPLPPPGRMSAGGGPTAPPPPGLTNSP